MQRHRAMLFDLDGTLVRTVEDHFLAWASVLKEYGIAIAPEDYFPIEGMPVRELAALFFSLGKDGSTGSRACIEELIQKKERYYLDHHQLRIYAGVDAFLDQLQTVSVPFGMVTAGLRHRIDNSLPPDFLSRFKVMITGDPPLRGKQHPDPYLKAAELLGAEPAECIVVENAPYGIQAAKSAGAHCVAICSTLDRSYLQGADEIAEAFSEIHMLTSVRNLCFPGNGIR